MTEVPAEVGEPPNGARMYDYFLGGAHNFAHDRAQAEAIKAALPSVVPTAWANRSFLRHAIEQALARGIDQFLDLGSGIPTGGNVHEIVGRHLPSARVVYVDHEPVVVDHAATLLADAPTATLVDADLRDAEIVVDKASTLLDLQRPTALLAVGVLHWIASDGEVVDALTAYRRALAPGSVLALAHISGDQASSPLSDLGYREAIRLYVGANPSHPRSLDGLRRIVEEAGFRLDAHGMVDVGQWAPSSHPAGAPVDLWGLITEPV